MTDSEICRSFLTAKSPQKQIKVLAELNGTTVQAITEVLTARGVDLASPRRVYKSNTPIGGGAEVQLPRRILKEAADYVLPKHYKG